MAILPEAAQEYAHLNSLLDPLDAVKATDPGLVVTAEADVRVPNSTPTNDPHRITFLVPTPEDVVFSMGAAGPAARIADVGITGRTKHHVHFVTTTAEAAAAANGATAATSGASPTLITLGGPATTALTDSHGGQVATTSRGFAMLTDGRSWLDAKEQFVAMSREGNVIVRAASQKGTGKAAVIQSDVGPVEITGKKAVSLSSAKSIVISADKDLTTVDHPYGEEKYNAFTSNLVANKVMKALLTGGDLAGTLVAFAATFNKLTTKTESGKATWRTGPSLDVVKFAVDAAKIVSTIGREAYAWAGYIDSIDGKTEIGTLEKVAIQTSGAASMTGEFSASIYGGLAASIASPLSASVLGGTASLKGLAWASIWGGFEASVKGYKDAKLEGEKGKVAVKSKLKAELMSSEAEVVVQGKKDVQLSSTDANAYVYGSDKVYVGAGKSLRGTGAGMSVDGGKQETKIGTILGGVGTFKAPSFNPKNNLTIKPGKLEANVMVSKFLMTNSAVNLKLGGDGVVISPAFVRVISKGRVLLG